MKGMLNDTLVIGLNKKIKAIFFPATKHGTRKKDLRFIMDE